MSRELPPLREVIAAHGLAADKRFGQHFLLDLNLTRKIARLCGDMSDATVFEVGPGPGGLTRALQIAEAARERGLELMVGNMLGTSLAMAPAFVLAQLCDVVDLDGPLLMAQDRTPAAIYADGLIDCPRAVWGAGAPSSNAAEAVQ